MRRPPRLSGGCAITEYSKYEVEFLRDVRVSELQLEAGQGIAHEVVAEELRSMSSSAGIRAKSS